MYIYTSRVERDPPPSELAAIGSFQRMLHGNFNRRDVSYRCAQHQCFIARCSCPRRNRAFKQNGSGTRYGGASSSRHSRSTKGLNAVNPAFAEISTMPT